MTEGEWDVVSVTVARSLHSHLVASLGYFVVFDTFIVKHFNVVVIGSFGH